MAVKVLQKRKTIPFNFGEEHKQYIRECCNNMYNILEGAVRSGKTVDNIYAFAHELKTTPDRLHLASGATIGTAKLNIGDGNGFGLENIFRGQCHWGKYKDNECLYIKGVSTGYKQKIVIFVGAGKSDSFKRIRGMSFGMWIGTEVNLHHDGFIKEAFNRTVASLNRKVFWDLNPDHPKHPIYTDYIDKYDRLNKTGKLMGGYNYRKFTLYDNINISDERIAEIISQYEEGSIWYNRDILGMRCIAEGLIYKKLASEFSRPKGAVKEHRLTIEDAKKLKFEKIVIAIDFGGTGSGHAIVASGITRGYDYTQKLVALKSRRYVEGEKDADTGREIKDIDPVKLGDIFVSFVENIIETYGFVTKTYGDSAEQVLIRGIKGSMNRAGLGYIAIGDSKKEKINDRIFTLDTLSAQGRFYYVEEECETLMNAISTAVWDSTKLTKNERLDNGSSDIDSLDAFEYTFERDMRRLINKFREKGGEES